MEDIMSRSVIRKLNQGLRLVIYCVLFSILNSVAYSRPCPLNTHIYFGDVCVEFPGIDTILPRTLDVGDVVKIYYQRFKSCDFERVMIYHDGESLDVTRMTKAAEYGPKDKSRIYGDIAYKIPPFINTDAEYIVIGIFLKQSYVFGMMGRGKETVLLLKIKVRRNLDTVTNQDG